MARFIATATSLMMIAGAPALAQNDTHREVAAHVHGEGTLEIAIEGPSVEITLNAPGADIVGFEHEAETAADRAAIEAAEATLADPVTLFGLPAAAGCVLDDGHWGPGSDTDHHAAHEDGQGHEHEHGHTDEEHGEFHGHYKLTCADPTALTRLAPTYFEAFESARALEVRALSGTGSVLTEATADRPVIDLSDLF